MSPLCKYILSVSILLLITDMVWGQKPPEERKFSTQALDQGFEIVFPGEQTFPAKTPFRQPESSKLKEFIVSPQFGKSTNPLVNPPKDPSEFMLRVMLLHLAKDTIFRETDMRIAIYMNNFYRNLYHGSISQKYEPSILWDTSRFSTGSPASAGVVFRGNLDLLELYYAYQRRKRDAKTRKVLYETFGADQDLLTKEETDARQKALASAQSKLTDRPEENSARDILERDTILAREKARHRVKTDHATDTLPFFLIPDSLLLPEENRDSVPRPAATTPIPSKR